MPHMLRVAAFQIRHPVPLIVLMKTYDGALWRCRLFIGVLRHVA